MPEYHNRKYIREAVHTLLLNNTQAGSNVYNFRVKTVPESELPIIDIKILDDPPDTSSKAYHSRSNRIHKASLDILVVVGPDADENVGDKLDEICKEIEDIIFQNPTLNDTVVECVNPHTEIGRDPNLVQLPHASAMITFEITYIKS